MSAISDAFHGGHTAPIEHELITNVTVTALDLDVPPTLLARADEVIE